MTQLTLGQRIASRRKLMGLSQEALAEQMSVSRQAVSKWESDATIPEIDKLISLGKCFEVSVGWLLGVEGVENEPSTQLEFSDNQLKTVEKLIAKYHPAPKVSWWKTLTGAILTVAITVGAISCYWEMKSLNANNTSAFHEISKLTEDNNQLQKQLSDLRDSLDQQNDGKRILIAFNIGIANIDEEKENITLNQIMQPKVFQENNKAYLHVQNPHIGYYDTFECYTTEGHGGKAYSVKYTIPVADGYKMSLILVNEYGYEEENLNLWDQDIEKLGTYCNFYIDPENEQFYKMQRNEPTLIHLKNSSYYEGLTYTYNVPLYTPHIFARTAVAYKDVRIAMLCNGQIIWEQSYRNEVYEAAGGTRLNAGNTPITPNIDFKLPKLNVGDELQLILTAETVNGISNKSQSYHTLLDYIKVVE